MWRFECRNGWECYGWNFDFSWWPSVKNGNRFFRYPMAKILFKIFFIMKRYLLVVRCWRWRSMIYIAFRIGCVCVILKFVFRKNKRGWMCSHKVHTLRLRCYIREKCCGHRKCRGKYWKDHIFFSRKIKLTFDGNFLHVSNFFSTFFQIFSSFLLHRKKLIHFIYKKNRFQQFRSSNSIMKRSLHSFFCFGNAPIIFRDISEAGNFFRQNKSTF